MCMCVCVYDKLNFDLSIILYLGVFISYQYIFHAKCLTSLDDDESCTRYIYSVLGLSTDDSRKRES